MCVTGFRITLRYKAVANRSPPVVVAGPPARGFLGTGISTVTGYDLICEATFRDSHTKMLPRAIYFCFLLSVGMVLSDAEKASEPQNGRSGHNLDISRNSRYSIHEYCCHRMLLYC